MFDNCLICSSYSAIRFSNDFRSSFCAAVSVVSSSRNRWIVFARSSCNKRSFSALDIRSSNSSSSVVSVVLRSICIALLPKRNVFNVSLKLNAEDEQHSNSITCARLTLMDE